MFFATKWDEEVQDEESERTLEFARKVSIALEVENILQTRGLGDNSRYVELLHQVMSSFSPE